MPLIEVRDLERRFVIRRKTGRLVRSRDEVVAVRDLTFGIGAGEMVGYIGPNGAGKSTTIKMLTGILVPTSGHLSVAGIDPSRRRTELARKIGVVFGQRTTLWWDLPLRDSFEVLQKIYRTDPARHRQNLAEYVELLDLGDLLDTPVRQLSLGQRMRADLAASLVHAPSILFLDEPTIGLDAVSKLAVRAFVKRLNRERGVTVILTTHDMDDIEALCERVLVIGDGTILSDGALADLRRRVTRERWLTVDVADGTASTISDPDATVIRRDGERVCLAFDPEVVSPAELIRRVTSKHAVQDLFVENPPIETVIARMYQR